MKSLLKFALALAALTCSANAQALFSVCLEVGPNAVYFGAHATYSGLLSPVVIHADSYVSGSDFRTGFTRSVGRVDVYHYYYDIAPGQINWGGMALQFGDPRDDSDRPFDRITTCSNSKAVPEPPPLCESEEPFNRRTTHMSSIEVNIGDYVRRATSGGIRLLRGLVSCESAGLPVITGAFQEIAFDQCCGNSGAISSAVERTGAISLDIPGFSCSIKKFRAHALEISGSVAISADASASLYGRSGICEALAAPDRFSGSISGTLTASVTVALLDSRFASASLTGYGPLNATFSGSAISNLSGSGCVGPVKLRGAIMLLSMERWEVETKIPNSDACRLF